MRELYCTGRSAVRVSYGASIPQRSAFHGAIVPWRENSTVRAFYSVGMLRCEHALQLRLLNGARLVPEPIQLWHVCTSVARRWRGNGAGLRGPIVWRCLNKLWIERVCSYVPRVEIKQGCASLKIYTLPPLVL